MADEPIASLGGKTPLEAANTPHMDALASAGKAPDFARYARRRFLRADGEAFE